MCLTLPIYLLLLLILKMILLLSQAIAEDFFDIPNICTVSCTFFSCIFYGIHSMASFPKNTWKFEQSNLKCKWLNFTFLSESIQNFCRHVHGGALLFPWGRFFWKVWMWQVFTTFLTFFPLHWMNKMQNANWFCIYHLKFDLKVSFNSIFKWNFFTRLHSETVCHTFHTIK